MQIVVVSGENRVLTQMDLHVQIARRPAVDAGFALARQADTVAFVHPSRDTHR